MIPGTVNECFEFGWKSPDIAERLQTPVIILSDLDLGMNHWMTDSFKYPDQPIDRGKILWESELDDINERLDGKWGRYLDIDGDGIPYRTVPGNKHPKSGYMGRGTSHDEYGRYTEDSITWETLMDRLLKKFETAKQYIPKPIILQNDQSSIGLICCGSTDLAVREAIYLLRKQNIYIDFMRIRGIPFSEEVQDFICKHLISYVVELNRDGQLRQLLMMEYPDCSKKLLKINSYDGLPITADKIIEQFLAKEGHKHE